MKMHSDRTYGLVTYGTTSELFEINDEFTLSALADKALSLGALDFKYLSNKVGGKRKVFQFSTRGAFLGEGL